MANYNPPSEDTANYRAKPQIEIDGNPVSSLFMEDILQIVVEESLHRPGMFTLVIQNDYFPGRKEDEVWRHKDLLQIGKSVRIGFTSSTTESPDFSDEHTNYILDGEITAIDTNFTGRSQAPVVVRGYDFSHRLHRGRYNRSFLNMTDSDIVQKITEEVGIKVGQLDPSGVVHDYIFQPNQTNMEFLRERAARIGFELFIQDGVLNFRKPKADSDELALKWLKDIHGFRVNVTSAEQVREVEVRGWDYTQKRPIVSTVQSASVITQTDNGVGSETSNKFNGKPPKPKMIIVDKPVFKPKEADIMAQALCDELGGQFISADAQSEGNAEVRAGKIVNLKDMGQHSGKYYITETRHTYSARVYTTDFSIRGNRGGNLFTALANQNKPDPGHTLLVGIVTDNQDPEGWGRVKVKFPTMTEEHASNWARVIAPGAGAGRGIYYLPEINDEVLVGFEHGDINRPYIIGGVWNGVDPTPRDIGDTVVDGKVRLRSSTTRFGHKTWFVDDDKGSEKRGYYIQTGTGPGHRLRFNDTEKFIEIETAGGQRIHLSDVDGSISIKADTKIDQTTTANISSKAASIDTSADANLSMKSGGATNLSAGATVSMTAGTTINISAGGAVTISTPGALSINAGTMTLTTTAGPITMITPINGPKPIL
ncbi:MAG: VgrG-related protein [Cyanobacteria bacterium J06639_18]